MRLVGWALALLGIALLALLGWQLSMATTVAPTILFGLSIGQTLAALAAIIGVGLALIARTTRRTSSHET
jgi:TRAP-type C4-dicarboxylate transport system permease small subunit